MASPLIRAFVALIVERPARRRGPAAQVEALEASGVAPLGPLTAGGWLRYLRQHADIESRRVRAGRG